MVRSRDLATVGVGPSGANDAEERCWSQFVHRIAENRIVPEGLQIGDDDEWGRWLACPFRFPPRSLPSTCCAAAAGRGAARGVTWKLGELAGGAGVCGWLARRSPAATTSWRFLHLTLNLSVILCVRV
jgi:hypothetical protein